MVSTTDLKNINKLLEAIEKDGCIDKYTLNLKTGVSISMYDKLKPYLLNLASHCVSYDAQTKIWKWHKNEVVESISTPS